LFIFIYQYFIPFNSQDKSYKEGTHSHTRKLTNKIKELIKINNTLSYLLAALFSSTQIGTSFPPATMEFPTPLKQVLQTLDLLQHCPLLMFPRINTHVI
jgi:hypothetical protein